MSGSHPGERGGISTLRMTSSLRATNNAAQFSHSQSSDGLQRHVAARNANLHRNPTSSMTLTYADQDGGNDSLPGSVPTIPFPPTDVVAQSELLQSSELPTWKDAADEDAVESPEELQKKDPLGTQIWKLYSRTKTRLPNQERMANLTWRMMAMNLRRREQEQALYDLSYRLNRATANFYISVLLRNEYPRNRTLAQVVSLSNFAALSIEL